MATTLLASLSPSLSKQKVMFDHCEGFMNSNHIFGGVRVNQDKVYVQLLLLGYLLQKDVNVNAHIKCIALASWIFF